MINVIPLAAGIYTAVHLIIGLTLALALIYRERAIPKYDWHRGAWFWATLLFWPLMLVVAILMGMLGLTGRALRRIVGAKAMIQVELNEISNFIAGGQGR